MEEMREKVALTALLMALLAVLVWIGLMVSSRSGAEAPGRFPDALWTMTRAESPAEEGSR
jgi:hypothetical protein